MNTTLFPVTRIRKLRKDAARATELPDRVPQGWSKSTVDLDRLLACFPALRLREGFRLCAYQFHEGGNGNGFVWALRDHVPFPNPDNCPRVEDRFLEPPKPPGAVHVMEAIEGDGSPWSYMSASIFAREAAEFGAMWHGISWAVTNVLWRSPFLQEEPIQDVSGKYWFLPPEDERSEWEWVSESPEIWRPSCTFDFEGVTVSFLTWSELGQESIDLCEDRYGRGSYRLESGGRTIATGGGGFCW
jgi:hypothetical protein